MTDTEEEIKDPWTPLAVSIETSNARTATDLLEALDAGDAARVVDQLDENQHEELMVLMEPEQAGGRTAPPKLEINSIGSLRRRNWC